MDPPRALSTRGLGHRSSFPPHTRGWTVMEAMSPESPETFPPHTRGWTSCQYGNQDHGGLFPPHTRGWTVFMSLSASAVVTRFPRTRGDGPAVFSSECDAAAWSTVSPAHAGMDLASIDRALWLHSFAFPPHTRGWTAGLVYVVRYRRAQVSPAHAGMDRRWRSRGLRSPVTSFPPHTRGWTCRWLPACGLVLAAFPPHTRGWT